MFVLLLFCLVIGDSSFIRDGQYDRIPLLVVGFVVFFVFYVFLFGIVFVAFVLTSELDT